MPSLGSKRLSGNLYIGLFLISWTFQNKGRPHQTSGHSRGRSGLWTSSLPQESVLRSTHGQAEACWRPDTRQTHVSQYKKADLQSDSDEPQITYSTSDLGSKSTHPDLFLAESSDIWARTTSCNPIQTQPSRDDLPRLALLSSKSVGWRDLSHHDSSKSCNSGESDHQESVSPCQTNTHEQSLSAGRFKGENIYWSKITAVFRTLKDPDTPPPVVTLRKVLVL